MACNFKIVICCDGCDHHVDDICNITGKRILHQRPFLESVDDLPEWVTPQSPCKLSIIIDCQSCGNSKQQAWEDYRNSWFMCNKTKKNIGWGYDVIEKINDIPDKCYE